MVNYFGSGGMGSNIMRISVFSHFIDSIPIIMNNYANFS